MLLQNENVGFAWSSFALSVFTENAMLHCILDAFELRFILHIVYPFEISTISVVELIWKQ